MRTRSHKALVRLLLSVTAIAGLLGLILPALMMRLQLSAGNPLVIPSTMASPPPRYLSFGTFQTLRNAMTDPEVSPLPSETSAGISLCFDGVAWTLTAQGCDTLQ